MEKNPDGTTKSEEQKKRKYVQHLTASASKRAKQYLVNKRANTRVTILNHWDKWHEIKKEKQLKSDAEVAELLIKMYVLQV
jgi:hypothetical protein